MAANTKTYQIECNIKASFASLLIDDLFTDRYMTGWGKYWLNVEGKEPVEMEYHWAETKTGFMLSLRQVDKESWFFRAMFPGGSHVFATQVLANLTLYKAESNGAANYDEITVIRANHSAEVVC